MVSLTVGGSTDSPPGVGLPVLSPDVQVSSQTAQPPRSRSVWVEPRARRVSGDSRVPQLKTAGRAQTRVWVPGLLLPGQHLVRLREGCWPHFLVCPVGVEPGKQ